MFGDVFRYRTTKALSMPKNTKFDCETNLQDVSYLLWEEPRLIAEKLVPKIVSNESSKPEELDYPSYYFGMEPESHQFICGLIREKKPKKILEVGVNQGGTTTVLLQALNMLNLDTKLYSLDIDPKLKAQRNISEWAPHLTDKWSLKFGRDASAYLEEIGENIDFCILDTAHFMPGEVLNFLCILPYLSDAATVVVDDQRLHLDESNEFVKIIGSPWTISCRVLFDTVTASKLIPIFPDNQYEEFPNIAAFQINSNTYTNVQDLFYALLLPWKFLPSQQALNDIYKSLKKNYPSHLIEVFVKITERQILYHIKQENHDKRAQTFWVQTMKELVEDGENQNVGFFGAGSYCKNIIEEWLPSHLHPMAIFDTVKKGVDLIESHCVLSPNEILDQNKRVDSIIVTSPVNHTEIEDFLHHFKKEHRVDYKVINPFRFQTSK